jgi:hypothetical protein
MLAESIVMDLARPCPSQGLVVETAWQSLSVESRLQVISAIQSAQHGYTPEWLLSLALRDSEAIVRYWACKSAAHSQENIARNDPSDLVRYSATQLSIFQIEALSSMPQPQRLVVLRSQRVLFSDFIDWLCSGDVESIADSDLAICALEFFARSDALGQLGESDLKKSWSLLLRKAGLDLAKVLARYLPFRCGRTTVDLEVLESLPTHLLLAVLDRVMFQDEFICDKLRERIQARPEGFSSEVHASVNRGGI